MITINNLEWDDLEELTYLYEELSGTKTDREKMQENFQWISLNPDYMLIGAKDQNEKLVGSLLGIICKDIIGECRPFMVIENMIVSKKYRGIGVGKKLMNYIEAKANERECYYILFVSSRERKEAHQFYESLGYELNKVQGFKKYL